MRDPLPPESESAQVSRSAGIVSLSILLSRLTGLVREVFMAHAFGAGFANDAFLLGFRIPNLTRDLFGEGALSAAFIPVFTATLKRRGKQEAAELANLVATAVLLVVGVVCIVGSILAPQLVWIMAPGFVSVPGKFNLAVYLTRVMFPFLLFIALAAQASGMLNALGSFGIAGLASVFLNIGGIVVGYLLGFVAGPHIGVSPIIGMGMGIAIGGLLQLVWQLPSLYRRGFRFRPAFNLSHPGLRLIFRLMLPALITSAAVQVNLVVNSNFASAMNDPLRGPNGPVSWLSYAFRLVHLPLGIFGIAVASAMLPSVSRSAAMHNFEEFRKTVAHSLSIVFLLTVPSSLILVILSRPLIGAVYQGGRFAAYDTDRTAMALVCYSLGLTAYAAGRMLASAFYALADARTPMYVSLLSVGLNIGLPLLFIYTFHLGFAALALTTAVASIVECVLLSELLRRRLGGLDGRYLFDCAKCIFGACALAGAPFFFLQPALAASFGASRFGYLAQIAIGLPLMAVTLFAILRLFRVGELTALHQMFVAPLRGIFRFAHAART